MSYLIAALGVRFTIGAFIYVVTVSSWVGRARGAESVAIFSQSVIFGLAAALAWLISVTISRQIAHRLLRLVVHAPLTVLLFMGLSYLIAGVGLGMRKTIFEDMAPYIGLMTFAALIDALVGHLLDDWLQRRRRMA